MGVYAYVNICIDRKEPLPVDTRVALVELAMKHELITKQCVVSVPKPMPIRGVIGLVKALIGQGDTYDKLVEKGEPGPWVATRVRAMPPGFTVESAYPLWKGESLTGPFKYTCYRRPKAIKVVNMWSDREPSPHEPPDGVIGRFNDVMELVSKSDVDARKLASSAFVRELKQLTGAKVICRTSWA